MNHFSPAASRQRPLRAGASALGTVLSLLLLTSTPAAAQDADRDPYWEIGLVGGMIDDRPEFDSSIGRPRLAHEGMVGGRIGVHLPSRFFLETEVLYTPMELVVADGGGSHIERLDGIMLLGVAGYSAPLAPILDLHLRSGLGGIRWNAGNESEVDFIFNAGAGLRLRIAGPLGIRTDARWHFAPSALASSRRELTPDDDIRGQPLWLGELSAGLSLYLGR